MSCYANVRDAPSYVLPYGSIGCVSRLTQCCAVYMYIFPVVKPSEATPVLPLPQCQRSRPPCVAPSISLTAPEDGKWCQSIHQSNTGGCAESGAVGVVMAAYTGGAQHMIIASLLQLFPLAAIADAAVP